MLATAWFWTLVLSLAAGFGVVFRGFYVMSQDGRLGLRFISFGSAIVAIGLAATFLRM